jgi:hypothetical protein
MRGAALFKTLVTDEELNKRERKGRSATLNDKRDECLLARFYYYTVHRGLCFEEVLKQVSIEFFITCDRIVKIIQLHPEEIKTMKEKKLSVYKLQHRWPHFKW